MQIGVFGGTGPAGSGLAARLASVGFDVVIGSRSKYRALEVRRQAPRASGRTSTCRSPPATTSAPPSPTSSSSPRRGTPPPMTAVGGRPAARGKVVISMANALAKVGHEFQPLVPPRGSVAGIVQAAVPKLARGRRVPPRAGQGARRPRPPVEQRRARLLRPPVGHRDDDRDRGARSPTCVRSTPASCRTPRRSRRSPRCCCSSTCSTRRASRSVHRPRRHLTDRPLPVHR